MKIQSEKFTLDYKPFGNNLESYKMKLANATIVSRVFLVLQLIVAITLIVPPFLPDVFGYYDFMFHLGKIVLLIVLIPINQLMYGRKKILTIISDIVEKDEATTININKDNGFSITFNYKVEENCSCCKGNCGNCGEKHEHEEE